GVSLRTSRCQKPLGAMECLRQGYRHGRQSWSWNCTQSISRTAGAPSPPTSKKSRVSLQLISHNLPVITPTSFERPNTFPLEGPKSSKPVTKEFAQAKMSDPRHLHPVPVERKTR